MENKNCRERNDSQRKRMVGLRSESQSLVLRSDQSISDSDQLVSECVDWSKLDLNGNKFDDCSPKNNNSKKKKSQVLLEGYVEAPDTEDPLKRTKSLTDDDLDELKGCLDLGFGFNYEEIPELCNTLPALELCYSMSQKFLDDRHKSPESSSPDTASATSDGVSSPIASWKISSPGDHPEDVKARLKFWAQTVACTVRLCS